MVISIGTIKSLHLVGNQIDDKVIPNVGEMLKNTPSLESLGMGSKITYTGIRELASYLKGNTSLKELNLQHNAEIRSGSLETLLEMVSVSRISNIDLTGTGITDKKQLLLAMVSNKLQNGSQAIYLNSR